MTVLRRRFGDAGVLPGILALLLALAACGGDAGVERTTDDDGTEVVTVTRNLGSYGALGAVGATPDLELTAETDNPADFFGSVRGVRGLPNGEIVVADGQDGRLAFFSPAGEPLDVYGGLGEAPGQFRTLSYLAKVNADSVWVWDRQAQRITIFERDGVVAQLLRLVPSDADRQYARAFVRDDRTFVAVSEARIASPPMQFEPGFELYRDTIAIVRHGDLGDIVGSVASFPGVENLRVWQAPQPGVIMTLVAPLPFQRSGHYAVTNDWIVGGPNDRFELSWWTHNGELRRVTRFRSGDRPIEPAVVDALRQQWLDDADGLEQRIELVDLAFDVGSTPEYFPAFDQILSGTDGTIWVREHDLTTEGAPRWWLFDPQEGIPEGYVDFPEGLQVHEIGPDYVLGMYRDSLGLQLVRRYSLQMD